MVTVLMSAIGLELAGRNGEPARSGFSIALRLGRLECLVSPCTAPVISRTIFAEAQERLWCIQRHREKFWVHLRASRRQASV